MKLKLLVKLFLPSHVVPWVRHNQHCRLDKSRCNLVVVHLGVTAVVVQRDIVVVVYIPVVVVDILVAVVRLRIPAVAAVLLRNPAVAVVLLRIPAVAVDIRTAAVGKMDIPVVPAVVRIQAVAGGLVGGSPVERSLVVVGVLLHPVEDNRADSDKTYQSLPLTNLIFLYRD